MAEMRWLLSVSISPEQERLPPEFTLRLCNLDDSGERPPISVTTVDDLVAVLLAAWQQRRPPSQPCPAAENHACQPTGTPCKPER
jgi:hypothetical protein